MTNRARPRIAVIGGGIAGASVAFELAERAAVTLFEAEPVCGYHATGRSAAVFTECYGDRVVRRLAMAGRSFLERPPDGFSEEALVAPMPLLFVATDAQVRRVERDLAEYAALVPSVRAVDGEEAVALCGTLDPASIVAGIFEPHACSIDVHALHLGYQRGARSRGAELRVASRVDGLTRSGSTWRVRCDGREVTVDVVVNAAGAWCDAVADLAGVRPVGLVPKRRTAFTFRPPERHDHRSWPMIIDIDERFYFRPEGERVLGSPADETPTAPCDARHDELDVAIGIDRIQAVTTMEIRAVDHAWAGLRSFVADHRPVNGWDPDAAGFYWLAGQGGFGIKTAPAMARLAAGLILDGEPAPDLTAAGINPADVGPARFAR